MNTRHQLTPADALALVDQSAEHWIWPRPRILVAKGKTSITATRLVWEAVRGAPPLGMCLISTCLVPKCVHPDHRVIGTKQEARRAMLMWPNERADNAGEVHPNARLRNRDVAFIRAQVDQHTGKLQFRAASMLAALFGVHVTTIYTVISRGRRQKLWRGVKRAGRMHSLEELRELVIRAEGTGTLGKWHVPKDDVRECDCGEPATVRLADRSMVCGRCEAMDRRKTDPDLLAAVRAGERSARELAEEFDVTPRTVVRVRARLRGAA